MKFLSEYRTPDNVKHSGTICAADKEAAYAALKRQGIKPCRFAEAPGVFNKLFGKGKRWIAIGVLGVGCLLLGVIASMFTAVVVTRFLMKNVINLGIKNKAMFAKVPAVEEDQK